MRLHYTPDEIVAFVREGADKAERVQIAAQMNCCPVAVIHGICQQYGMEVALPESRWSRAKLKQLRSEIAIGKTVAEIAREFGVAHNTISYQMKKHNIQYPKKKNPETDEAVPGQQKKSAILSRHH